MLGGQPSILTPGRVSFRPQRYIPGRRDRRGVEEAHTHDAQMPRRSNQDLQARRALPRYRQGHVRLTISRLLCTSYDDHRSEPIATANGYSVVRTIVAHGVHELFHGNPNIPHYAKNKTPGTMKPGMVSLPSSPEACMKLMSVDLHH